MSARVEVEIEADGLAPADVAVAPGTTVVWHNMDNLPRTVQSRQEGLFDSGWLESRGAFSFTFRESGRFDYFSRGPTRAGARQLNGTIFVN